MKKALPDDFGRGLIFRERCKVDMLSLCGLFLSQHLRHLFTDDKLKSRVISDPARIDIKVINQ